jgi:transcriptional regulator with XRE-family HTH domain
MTDERKEPKRYVEIDGRELRYLRKKAKLTQQQLASLVAREHHLARGYIPNIERQPQVKISEALAEALANALEVSVDRLLPTAQSGLSFGAPKIPERHSEGRIDLLKEILREIAEINRRTDEIRRVAEELLRGEERVR